jgi:hypothetical protein
MFLLWQAFESWRFKGLCGYPVYSLLVGDANPKLNYEKYPLLNIDAANLYP